MWCHQFSLKKPHNRHPAACPWGMGCLLWVLSLIYVLIRSQSCCMYCPILLYHCFNEVERGYTGFMSVRLSVHLSVCPSVCGQNCVCTVSSTIWDLFHICTSYQAISEGVSYVSLIAKFYHLNLWQFFYPRPVLAFGYCRCLRLSVCTSVCAVITCLSTR